MMLWTSVWKFLCRWVFSVFLRTYIGVEFLSHMTTLTFWETSRLFSKVAVLFYVPISSVRGFHPGQHLLFFVLFFIVTIPVGVKWSLMVILICIFLNGCCCCRQVASVVSDSVRPLRWQPTRLPCRWDSPGKNIEVSCPCLLRVYLLLLL